MLDRGTLESEVQAAICEVLEPEREDEALLEDLRDLAVMAQRRDEPSISFEEGKSKLNADGLR
jgi:uncharacterized protein YfkK (UPF0435 family)